MLSVSSADHLCKTFGYMSGPTKSRARSRSELFDNSGGIPDFNNERKTGDNNMQRVKDIKRVKHNAQLSVFVLFLIPQMQYIN